MDAKQKAKELIEKFMYELMAITNIADRAPTAKACALISVDEIINETKETVCDVLDWRHSYWQQVKSEVENI